MSGKWVLDYSVDILNFRERVCKVSRRVSGEEETIAISVARSEVINKIGHVSPRLR